MSLLSRVGGAGVCVNTNPLTQEFYFDEYILQIQARIGKDVWIRLFIAVMFVGEKD